MSSDEHMKGLPAGVLVAALTGCAVPPAMELSAPLAAPGDAVRGREIFISREGGHCVLCHAAPGVALAGDVGPAMSGVGARFTVPQLRLRVADITRVRPDAAMPTFHRTTGLDRVAPELRGKPVLTAQQVEDVVAYLETLK